VQHPLVETIHGMAGRGDRDLRRRDAHGHLLCASLAWVARCVRPSRHARGRRGLLRRGTMQRRQLHIRAPGRRSDARGLREVRNPTGVPTVRPFVWRLPAEPVLRAARRRRDELHLRGAGVGGRSLPGCHVRGRALLRQRHLPEGGRARASPACRS
jgi:hypothetical protein